MRRLVPTILLSLTMALSPAMAEAHLWHADYSTVQKAAIAESKPIMLFFTGSDWCPPCISMKKDVLNTEEFKTLAGEDFILGEIDFPRKSQLPENIAKQNAHLAEHYHIEGYPTIVLLGEDGRPFWMEMGAVKVKPKTYYQELHKHRLNFDQFLKLAGEAKMSSGMEAAKKLAAALSLLPHSIVHRYYQKELGELAQLDPKDEIGFRKELINAAERAALETELNQFFKSRNFGNVIQRIDEYLKARGNTLDKTELQRLHLRRAFACVQLHAFDEALAGIDTIVEIDPESSLSRRAGQIRRMIENRREHFQKKLANDAEKEPAKKREKRRERDPANEQD